MNKKYAFLSMNQLKVIAMTIMLIDHFAFVMLERGIGLYGDWYLVDRIMRGIGRIAFPVFCFSVVEGFQKTRNVKKYLQRLVLFALLSEIPFDLAFRGSFFAPDYQNVFWTLSFGLAALIFYENSEMESWKRTLGMTVCLFLPVFLHTDYSFYGVLLILFMYKFRNDRLLTLLSGMLILMLQTPSEIWAVFGFLLIFLYNGERGKGNKYLFYGFYPVHLLVLVALKPYICENLLQIIGL